VQADAVDGLAELVRAAGPEELVDGLERAVEVPRADASRRSLRSVVLNDYAARVAQLLGAAFRSTLRRCPVAVILRLMRLVSVAGVCGGVLTLAATGVYVSILVSQGDTSIAWAAPWVALFLAVGLVGLAASFTTKPRLRLQLFAACTVVMLIVGVLAIFSIGILLLVAALLFASAAISARHTAGANA